MEIHQITRAQYYLYKPSGDAEFASGSNAVKSADSSSIASDSAIGGSSIITGTTAKETQYSEVSLIWFKKYCDLATLYGVINPQHIWRKHNYSVQPRPYKLLPYAEKWGSLVSNCM